MKGAIYRHIALITTLLVAVSVSATEGKQNAIGFSVAGGAMGSVATSDEANLKTLIGGAAELNIVYLLQRNHFLFQASVGAAWQMPRLGIEAYTTSRQATDILGEQHQYIYELSNYKQTEKRLSPQLMLMAGYQSDNYFYLLAGAKLRYSLLKNYSLNTTLQTAGNYERWASDRIVDREDYGFYPASQFTYSGTVASYPLAVAPTLEVGAALPIGSKLTMRIAAFADYQINIGSSAGKTFVDYSHTDMNAKTQSLRNLQQTLVINSLTDTELIKTYSNYEVGVRLTVLFNVKHRDKRCRCEDD